MAFQFGFADEQQERAPDSPTAAHLKYIVELWPIIICTRDFDYQSEQGKELKACIAPDFEARLDGYPGAFNLEQLADIWRKEIRDAPEAAVYANSTTAYVDEAKGTATLYMELDLVPMKDVTTKACNELKWTRNGSGKWMIRTFHGIRGNSGLG